MSFMNGPDCGPINPLQSLLKHSERDASVQHDRFASTSGPGASNAANGMRTAPSHGNGAFSQAELDREMQQFSFGLPGQQSSGGVGPSAAGAFNMEAMQRDLAQFHSNGSGSQTPMNPEWAKQFDATRTGSPNPQQAEAWRRSFLSSPAGQQQQQQQHQPGVSASSSSSQQVPVNFPMYGSQMPYSSYGGVGGGSFMQAGPMAGAQQYQPAPGMTAVDAKGKSRFVELDDSAWEAQFAKLDAPKVSEGTATAHMPNAFQDQEATKENQATIDAAEDESDDQFLQNLDRTWKNLKDTMDTSNLNDRELAAWEAQYGTNFADLNGGEFDYDGPDTSAFDPAAFDQWLRDATAKPYPFAADSENPYLEAADAFAEGHRLLREGHPLAEAALAFEAACKQDGNRGEAWKALGDTLAADEKEVKAIKALERAVSCPDQGGEGAWMSLAISYVNEGQDMRAFNTLEKWISTAYPEVTKNVQTTAESSNPWSINARIAEMFMAAARAGPQARLSDDKSMPVDADVQSGLGVLFYTSSDYSRARDCFEAALSVRPDDFLLWNRLGATLANGGQPEDAIEAYRKALELRPTFTRAIYNLGVSCLNINCFQEAAEHLLAALELHRKDKNVGKGKGLERSEALELDDGSGNLWNTLRRAFLCLERPDLADRARPGADVEAFRKDGFSF